MADEQNAQVKNPEFEILRVYNKDISLETPNVPEIFQQEWKPETKLDLDVKYKEVDQEKKVYEVVLRITITSKLADKVAFVCEVNQAGLFHIDNIPAEQLDGFLNAFIPNILFPYARETVSSLINKATFPPLNLAPLNFDAIYMQRKQQQAAQANQQA